MAKRGLYQYSRRVKPVSPGLFLLFLALPLAADEGELAKIKEQELEEVREQISALKQSMDAAAEERDRLTGELQDAEVTISEKRLRLKELEREKAYTERRRRELDAAIVERETELDYELGQLSEQVRTAYMSGGQERLKLLLNQRDPATLGRLAAYYRYLNDYRSDNIDTVSARLRELASLHSEVAAEEARLNEIAKARYAELAELDGAQEARQQLLASLRQRIAAEGREVDRLAAQEKDLARLIAELTSILSDYPISSEAPFSEHRGRLTWPVAGAMLHDFGQPRVGGRLKWNGVVLSAPRGREVRAVYHGRVIFADWLAGMGLLVIVDHGEGYMTLYGYTETILKDTGDWVAPGDVIATVGDSGGQPQSALYFELRQGARPVPERAVTPVDGRFSPAVLFCWGSRGQATPAWGPAAGKRGAESSMSLKIRAILVVVIGTVMGLSLSIGGGLLSGAAPVDREELAWEQARLFAEVLERVKRDYVEPIDDAELLESAIRGMVDDLDAHSQYLDAEQYRDIRISTTGSYTGVGIEVAETPNGELQVITPIAESPAARSGIRSGDIVVAVDGIAVKPGALQEAIGRMRGRPGSDVSITVRRDQDFIVHQMHREIVRVASVHHELLKPAYGYIRLSQFSETTARELSGAIDDLLDDNGGMLDGLVLDPRNNPGGVLDAAVDVADMFLDAGVIVTAEGRASDARFARSAHRGDVLDGASLVVLVNSGSASASEIVAGALQDHGRALIVGTETFGKGLVQTVMPLTKGRAIKLTTSRYFTPSGESIHESGITPDVYVDNTPGYPNASLIGAVDKEHDEQLIEAIERLRHPGVMHSNAQ